MENGVCEEDVEKFEQTSSIMLKQLDNSTSISMSDRNIDLII